MARAARETYVDPRGACAIALDVERRAAAVADADLQTAAIAVCGCSQLLLGKVDEATATAARLELRTPTIDATAEAFAAAFRAQLAFHLGGYRPALRAAGHALTVADDDGAPLLRLDVRRWTSMVLGNLDSPRMAELLDERLALGIELDDPWEQALSHNDIAYLHVLAGDLDAAQESLDRARAILRARPERAAAPRAAVAGTSIALLREQGQIDEALALAEQVVADLERDDPPLPYLYAMSIIDLVEMRVAAGDLAQACADGERGVERLGSAMPLIRARLLATLAGVLRETGRLEEAFDALLASTELERAARTEFAALQDDLERAEESSRTARRETLVLREQAERDPLTGVANRRALAHLGDYAAVPLVVVAIDLDRFKEVNDTVGHAAGDLVLVRVAELLSDDVRDSDLIIRLGGDEFIVVMVGADRGDGEGYARRLQARFDAVDWSPIAPGIALSASVGIAIGTSDRPIDELIARADEELLEVKRSRGAVPGR